MVPGPMTRCEGAPLPQHLIRSFSRKKSPSGITGGGIRVNKERTLLGSLLSLDGLDQLGPDREQVAHDTVVALLDE